MDESRPKGPSARRAGAVIGGIGLCWVAAALFWAAPAPFSIDGFVYIAMTDAFARDLSLFVENGYAEHKVEALRLFLMIASGDRLAPQYPGGWGILAAPAYLLGGVHGMMLINTVSSILTLVLTWRMARHLFEDHRIALAAVLIYAFATFAADYAFGIWPHAATTLLVTAGACAAAKAWRGAEAREPLWALAAGVALGLAINIRVDALFALPPVALWLMGAGRRPYRSCAFLMLGLLPGVAMATIINEIKFGVLSPISYGRSEGVASVGFYSDVLIVGVGAAGLALTLGLSRVRAFVYRPFVMFGLLTAVAIAVLLLPPTRSMALRMAEGIWILVVDFQQHPFPGRGLAMGEDGTIYIFGLLKKALLQSLPFAAAVVVLLPGLFTGRDRAPLTLLFLFVVMGILPLAYTTWHGGMASNMRYFLNFLPMLAILGAAALRRIGDEASGGSRVAVAAMMLVFAIGVLWPLSEDRVFAAILQVALPNALAAVLALLCMAVLLLKNGPRAQVAKAAQGVMMIAFLVAAVNTHLIDLQRSQRERDLNRRGADMTADLPPDALVVTFAAGSMALRLNQPPALTAQPDFLTREIDDDLGRLVLDAFEEGRPVIVDGSPLAENLIARGLAGRAEPMFEMPRGRLLYRMEPRSTTGGEPSQ